MSHLLRNNWPFTLFTFKVWYLCDKGADVNRGQRSSSLHYAACFGRPAVAKVTILQILLITWVIFSCCKQSLFSLADYCSWVGSLLCYVLIGLNVQKIIEKKGTFHSWSSCINFLNSFVYGRFHMRSENLEIFKNNLSFQYVYHYEDKPLKYQEQLCQIAFGPHPLSGGSAKSWLEKW